MTDSWQQLADIEISVPGFGRMTVEQLLEQISASDGDPAARDALVRATKHLAKLLAPLPAAERDEIIERITDAVREAYGRDG